PIVIAPITPTTTSAAPAVPTQPSSTAPYWIPLDSGCILDAVAGQPRTFFNFMLGGATQDTCKAAAVGAGYKYFGVEYGGECWAGNEFRNTTSAAAPASDCNMPCNADPTQLCGSGNRLSAFVLYTPPAQPYWAPIGSGCLQDTVGGTPRTFANFLGGDATVETCLSMAMTAGYTMAGIEYGGECWADNAFHNTTITDAPATDCNMPCNNNASEICGAGFRLSAYAYILPGGSTPTPTPTSSAVITPTPSAVSTGNWAPIGSGCIQDVVNGQPRTFSVNLGGGSNFDLCSAAALSGNYMYFGLEYGGECWADNSFHNTTSADAPATDCSMKCNSNPLQLCGNGNRLTAYSYNVNGTTSSSAGTTATVPPTSTYTTVSTTTSAPAPTDLAWRPIDSGCLLDTGNPRTFGNFLLGGATVETCQAAAGAKGYVYMGLDWADSLYRNLTSAAAPATDCTMKCNANAAELCGAGNRLSAYYYGTSHPFVPTTTSDGATTTAAATSTSATPTPTPSGLPAGWGYVGCFKEGTSGRALAGMPIPATATMTNEHCATQCLAKGFAISGTEFGQECYCGNDIRNGGAAAAETDCTSVCAGNTAEKCGGGNRLTVYSSITPANITIWPAPVLKKTGLPAGYSYVGCYMDNVPDANGNQQRTLQWQYISLGKMTVEMCISHCFRFGYKLAGLEYGSECYCEDNLLNGGILAPGGDAECSNIPCEGNPGEYCGNGGRLAVYTYNTAVSTFSYPANTGRYEYFIGGVTVPLLTALTTTNKVVMLERVAGGEANSTHAYELDYSTNDYRTAFREMHVPTDVFCSAGIMLPDKPGRILNVGGWADLSLEGVRLYTPTGSAGVNGTTDWEENVNTLHLQVPRWYPSALQLLNGSIAVIGGETNSNGANQPSVEILPATGTKPITLEILAVNTDPYNLYPHVFTLPTGKVFIAAHNRAQVLDPDTWETTISLPNMPGGAVSVNGDPDGTGGRTYPMSGTGVLLPLSPPYTDPVTILVCGGSIGAGGTAVDNCVSTQPEVPGAQWVIERMPFKRVMPNIVHLPDGTFLIVNGCKFGVAGFGLGQDPTFTAVLYDPTKPVNARMSVLNSTIVARMYHSEALLLHDGRVLITGSDPQEQEQGYPEEHRIEMYIPPYLTNGKTRPTFTITSSTQVNFGAQLAFTANLPSNGPIRVSMVSPGVNTHGNTMGSRLVFLSVAKQADGSYLATMPPNQGVAPANHYLIYVLDGPTPSVGQWIRLGGDPGNLSSWPNLPGFTLPN
ncbi:hypothetical protein HDU76_002652, partial [Blyttiomyces sp. JEL0837]